jgi:hypothetical protein
MEKMMVCLYVRSFIMSWFLHDSWCRNPSLGFATKARVYKVVAQKENRESHNILPRVWEGVREWTLTPQGSSILGVGVPVDSRIFRGRLQGSKLNGLKSSLYQWKYLETYISKMGSHSSFEHLKHKLWPKERWGVKLGFCYQCGGYWPNKGDNGYECH